MIRLRLNWALSVLVISLGVFWPTPARCEETNANIARLAFGDIRGNLESCGCYSEDLGGLRRIGYVVAQERKKAPNLNLYSLGNNLPGLNYSGNIKIPVITEAISILEPTAALVNYTEILHFQAMLKKLNSLKKEPHSYYVLSNLKENSFPAKISSPIIIKDGIQVLGYFYHKDFDAILRPIDDKLLAYWSRLLAKQPARKKILLFAGLNSELEAIYNKGLFDEIIRSSPSPVSDTLVGIEPRQVSFLKFTIGQHLVYAVPIGGSGVLRKYNHNTTYVWLTPELDGPSALTSLLAQFE